MNDYAFRSMINGFRDCPHCNASGVLLMKDGRCPNCKKILPKHSVEVESPSQDMEFRDCPHCKATGMLVMSNGLCPNCKQPLHKHDDVLDLLSLAAEVRRDEPGYDQTAVNCSEGEHSTGKTRDNLLQSKK